MAKPEKTEKLERVWSARHTSEEEQKTGDIYNILPKSLRGKLSMTVYLSGVVIFLAGVISGSSGFPYASAIAVIGMVVYFIGGYLKVHHD